MPAENLPKEQNLLRMIDWNKMSRCRPNRVSPLRVGRKGKIEILIGSEEGKSQAKISYIAQKYR